MPSNLVIAHAGSLTATLHDDLIPSFMASFGGDPPYTVTCIVAFVKHLFGEAGYAALLRHGFMPIAPEVGGDPAAIPAPLQPLLGGRA